MKLNRAVEQPASNQRERSLLRIVTRTLWRPARLPGQGLRAGPGRYYYSCGYKDPPERLRPGPNLAPRVSPIAIPSPEELAWQLPTSTAPPSFGQTGACRKRERESIIRYKQDREDGYRTTSVGVSQHQVYMYIDALCRSPNAEGTCGCKLPIRIYPPGSPRPIKVLFLNR